MNWGKCVLAGFAILCACSQSAKTKPNDEHLVTGDPTIKSKWSVEKERETDARARAGDLEAAKLMYQHSLIVGDLAVANKWEPDLIRSGYAPALTRKSELLLDAARKLDDRDPNKPRLLNDADALASQAAAVPRPKELQIYANGREVIIPNTAPDDLKSAIEREQDRLKHG